MAFEHYLQRDGKRLRYGYTTGVCAALAAQAATLAFLSGKMPATAELVTPKGITVTVDVQNGVIGKKAACCAVAKDAGDDIDATHGILIYAEVKRSPAAEIIIDGGQGVGRVTRPGLDQPVGAAAINSVPRRMIYEQVKQCCIQFGYSDGLEVIISIPEGERIAAKTFNPELGIVGGLSILGTSGIVEPQSLQALVDTIEAELKMLAAEGHKNLLIAPGNFGEEFAANLADLQDIPRIKCSNFIGETIDIASDLGYNSLLLVGHIGKLVKVAGGILNTHSRYGDCRVEILTAHAALAGADTKIASEIMNSVTTDAALDILEAVGLRQKVAISLIDKIQHQLERRARQKIQVGVVLFSSNFGYLGQSASATSIISAWQHRNL